MGICRSKTARQQPTSVMNGHRALTMSLFPLLMLISAVAAQVPPAPCPSTPANYCECGDGDHGYKWLCRANNGYT